MNIKHALEHAERFLNDGDAKSAEGLISYAEGYLNFGDPDGTLDNVPTFCCFFASREGGIHCGRSDREPLFPGTWEERVKLCHECRQWCRQKIKELREKIKEVEGG